MADALLLASERVLPEETAEYWLCLSPPKFEFSSQCHSRRMSGLTLFDGRDGDFDFQGFGR